MRSTGTTPGRRLARLLCMITVLLLFPLIFMVPGGQGTAAPPGGSAVVTREEAYRAAGSWLKFVLERDGQWAGSTQPSLGTLGELRRGAMTTAYYVPVSPRGYIALSILRDFAPIMAYSTESDLVPAEEEGMAGLLKDVGQTRIEYILRQFGSLEAARLGEIDPATTARSRELWSRLLVPESGDFSELSLILPTSSGRAGPLLRSFWSQRPPYNNLCPNQGCSWPGFGNFNQNAVAGCVPLGMAQIMRYYAWPPSFRGQPYQWTDMLDAYIWDSIDRRFEDLTGAPVSQAQIDAVADLVADAGSVLDIDYGCNSTTAYMCNWYYDDARDAFEDHFFYSDPRWDEPMCEERDSYDFLAWWYMIVEEIDHNRPMLYRIADDDFSHLIVVDGYDDTGGHYQVHANYGWGLEGHTTWYTLDEFDCSGPCDWGEYEMVRMIYPRTGLCVHISGLFSPASVPYYVYCDLLLYDVTIQGGAWFQFLPGKKITCAEGSFADILGNNDPGTRFYSEGLWSRGLKISGGGKVKLYPNGSIKMY